ncbi:MAG: hypothetical protein QGH94_01780 [Phycisphaerae bacterium]|nr:hypothetical protein [Phycisphaerae bacterium]
MEVRMEHTEGFARKAEVLLDNESLIVCDGVSTPEMRCGPGVIENVKFSYPSLEGFQWSQAIKDNPSNRVRLEHIRGWSYMGFGRVLSIMPVTIDYGMIQLEDPNWSDDEALAGKYVKVMIDRLDLNIDDGKQWPEELR